MEVGGRVVSVVGGTVVAVVGGAVVAVVAVVGGSVVGARVVVVAGRVVEVVVGGGVGMGRMTGRGGLGLPSLGGTGPTMTAMRFDRAMRPAELGWT